MKPVQNALSKEEQLDLILETIPNSARIGDDWNEIQASLRELEFSDEPDTEIASILQKLSKFAKRH